MISIIDLVEVTLGEKDDFLKVREIGKQGGFVDRP